MLALEKPMKYTNFNDSQLYYQGTNTTVFLSKDFCEGLNKAAFAVISLASLLWKESLENYTLLLELSCGLTFHSGLGA
jgi:hypothetical protein